MSSSSFVTLTISSMHMYSRSVGAGAGAELPSLSTSPPTGSMLLACSPPPSTSSPPYPEPHSNHIHNQHKNGSISASGFGGGCGSASLPNSPPLSPKAAHPLPPPPAAPTRLRTFHGHGGPVWAVDCDDEGGWMASGSYDQCVKVRMPMYVVIVMLHLIKSTCAQAII
jgi:hypothetical protein